ncbi:MAG: hypothetical protein GBAus27B_000184 [Mycoplasmataceae bacterium]|nr:MAG: hypothetical protein GBAus27B_000184 [Mycoplasmataceae bacterium]
MNNLVKKWDKRYLLLVMAVICLALYFFGSAQTLPNTNFLRPFGYLCLGMGGMLNLMTTN